MNQIRHPCQNRQEGNTRQINPNSALNASLLVGDHSLSFWNQGLDSSIFWSKCQHIKILLPRCHSKNNRCYPTSTQRRFETGCQQSADSSHSKTRFFGQKRFSSGRSRMFVVLRGEARTEPLRLNAQVILWREVGGQGLTLSRGPVTGVIFRP